MWKTQFTLPLLEGEFTALKLLKLSYGLSPGCSLNTSFLRLIKFFFAVFIFGVTLEVAKGAKAGGKSAAGRSFEASFDRM